MKPFFSIVTASAAVVAGLIRLAINSENAGEAEGDRGSPVPRITAKLVEQLAYAGATDAEIADRFLVDEATMRQRYRDTLRVARALRRIALRSLQFDLARKLNVGILTWLGRNELGQTLNPTASDDSMPQVD
jgi:hypothetical protein